MAEPDLVGLLRIPGDRGGRAVDLVLERVLPAGADLADADRAAGAVLEAQQDRRGVLGGDLAGDGLGGDVGREGLDRAGRLAARLDEGGQVGHDRDDALAGHEGHQVEPVRADVADRPESAAAVRLETPVPVAVEEQPVLEVATGHEPDVADVAARDDLVRVLVERVVADVEVGRVDEPGRGGRGDQLARLRRRTSRAASRTRRAGRRRGWPGSGAGADRWAR